MNNVERTRALVCRYGWNSTAFQLINPGLLRWFATDEDGVIGFARGRGWRVVAGAPVCAHERLGAITQEFEAEAADCGEKVCYFGAEARLEALFLNDATHSLLQLGAQPAWSPQHWAALVAGKSSLRAQLNRARNKGVTVNEWSAEKASNHPALKRCLRAWLATKGLPPLHFVVETETLERLAGRRIMVAEQRGEVVGFVVASPVPQRNGWLIEQNVRGADAPNGTAELQIDATIRALAASGADYVTLGLSPLSTRAQVVTQPTPWLLRLLLAWTRAHGRRFYNFDGLDAFKAKFQPERWEPVYAIVNTPHFPVSALYAIAQAFCGGALWTTAARALWQAARTETRWLLARGRISAREVG